MQNMQQHLKTAEFIANLLDNKFSVAGHRFGINGPLGLLPVVGDFLPSLLSMYLIWVGQQMNLPRAKMLHMIWNVIVNFLIGLFPVVGDYIDFFHKANLHNLRILKEHHAKHNVVEGEVVR